MGLAACDRCSGESTWLNRDRKKRTDPSNRQLAGDHSGCNLIDGLTRLAAVEMSRFARCPSQVPISSCISARMSERAYI